MSVQRKHDVRGRTRCGSFAGNDEDMEAQLCGAASQREITRLRSKETTEETTAK